MSDKFEKLLHQIQRQASPFVREEIAKILSNLSKPGTSSEYKFDINELEKSGCQKLQNPLSPEEVEEIRTFFSTVDGYSAHVCARSDGIARNLSNGAMDYQYLSFPLATIRQCPHISKILSNKTMHAVAKSYLGQNPILYSINTFWNFPNPRVARKGGAIMQKEYDGVQTWHRDKDDFKFLAFFIFLTDTSESDGSHLFVESSHRSNWINVALNQIFKVNRSKLKFSGSFSEQELINQIGNLLVVGSNLSDDLLKAGGAKIREISGKAGDFFVEDTFGIHKGVLCKRPRLMMWIRLGLYENIAFAADHFDTSSSVRKRYFEDIHGLESVI